MDSDKLIHSEYYRGFTIQVIETPDAELWAVGYYYCIYDEDGTERLDGNEQDYQPKDFLHRDPNDTLNGARYQINRYWQFGERWHVPDAELQLAYYLEAVEQGYRV